jgi:hypothetical protein
MGAVCIDQAVKVSLAWSTNLVFLARLRAQRPQAGHGFEVFLCSIVAKNGHKFIYFYLFSSCLKCVLTNLFFKLAIKLDRIMSLKSSFFA